MYFLNAIREVLNSATLKSCFALLSQAAHYGCGCWAENACNMNPYSTAVSTSGKPQLALYSLLCSGVHATSPPAVKVHHKPAVCFGNDTKSETDFLKFNANLVSRASSVPIILSDDLRPFLPISHW